MEVVLIPRNCTPHLHFKHCGGSLHIFKVGDRFNEWAYNWQRSCGVLQYAGLERQSLGGGGVGLKPHSPPHLHQCVPSDTAASAAALLVPTLRERCAALGPAGKAECGECLRSLLLFSPQTN